MRIISGSQHSLLTESEVGPAHAGDGQETALQQAARNMLANINLDSGDQDMFIMDVPDIGPPQQSVVVAQNASSTSAVKSLKMSKIVLAVPWLVANDLPLEPGNPTSFVADLSDRACSELLQDHRLKNLHWTSPTCKIVEIVTPPKHGSLVSEGNGVYRYTPTHGLLGKDQVQFIVEGTDGRHVFVTLPILLQTAAEAYSANGFGTNWIASWMQSGEQGVYAASWGTWLRAAVSSVSLSLHLKN